MGKPTDQHTKATILAKIRDDGMSVTEASAKYDVTSKSIYRWLHEGVEDASGNRNLVLELNRVKKENDQLYKLLGRATAEMQRSKE